jgi:chloride channel protein, CIC family
MQHLLQTGTARSDPENRERSGVPIPEVFGVNVAASESKRRWFDNSLLRRYSALVSEDLSTTYSRDIQKWLLVAPIIGILSGLVITGIAKLILGIIWAAVLPYMLAHHASIIPIVLVGFLMTGLIMQFLTRDPDRHSTEEIIESYHEHQGDIDIHPFWYKLIAAVTTVGLGGSAALEGPSIYGGGAIGSWLWVKLRRFGLTLDRRDRRIMLISGAAAGMAAVFRAPLTGLIFSLEMPYKDDLAHEALLPSLIASVASYAVLVAFMGPAPLFAFGGAVPFSDRDLLWSALLGVICGFIAMNFANGFRRTRTFFVNLRMPHTVKLLIGGLLTGVCGLLFVTYHPGNLIPLGPNYEAVPMILSQPRGAGELVAFAFAKLMATLFSLGSGGVSAMFVPLFLSGGALGKAFAHLLVHASQGDLFAAVGMASFIAAGYKTPLAAVVFVSETSGSHSYIIPTLIGAAVAYAVSGEASVSGDQRLHQEARVSELGGLKAEQAMQSQVVSVQASSTLRAFADSVAARHRHAVFPVYEGSRIIGAIPVWALSRVPVEQWDATRVGEVAERDLTWIAPDTDLNEALRLLTRENAAQMLLVSTPSNTDGEGLAGILTKTDILRALSNGAVATPRALTVSH